MKILLISLFTLFCSCAHADNILTYYAYAYSYAEISSSGKYYWSDWKDCSLNITLDLDEDRIFINSKSPQLYTLVSSSRIYYKDGIKVYEWDVVDQDLDRGTVRMLDNKQIYICFKDIAWAYIFK